MNEMKIDLGHVRMSKCVCMMLSHVLLALVNESNNDRPGEVSV